jgi:hypothetical protein
VDSFRATTALRHVQIAGVSQAFGRTACASWALAMAAEPTSSTGGHGGTCDGRIAVA